MKKVEWLPIAALTGIVVLIFCSAIGMSDMANFKIENASLRKDSLFWKTEYEKTNKLVDSLSHQLIIPVDSNKDNFWVGFKGPFVETHTPNKTFLKSGFEITFMIKNIYYTYTYKKHFNYGTSNIGTNGVWTSVVFGNDPGAGQ